MKDWRTICKKLLFPPGWLLMLLTVFSAAALAVIFAKGWDDTPAAYAVYVLAFYTLSVLCAFCAVVFPQYYRKARQTVYNNKYGGRYMTDVAFKTQVSLWISLGINLLYAAVNFLSGFLYQSAWFAILGGYHTILAVMRFLLLRFVNRVGIGKNRILELRRSRLCGIILMTVNLALSGAVLMMIYQNRGYEYHGMLIYVMALYTFFITAQAVANLFRYRKYDSPVMSAAKVVSFVSALVSMLSLETAMISQFGADEPLLFRNRMIGATGAGVCVITVVMSVAMIIRANRKIRSIS